MQRQTETVINESDVNNAFESICSAIISNIQKPLNCVDSGIDHIINISKYNSLATSSYIKLPNIKVPALSYDAILNMKKVEFGLISNADIYLFFIKGMRGGSSYHSKRCK